MVHLIRFSPHLIALLLIYYFSSYMSCLKISVFASLSHNWCTTLWIVKFICIHFIVISSFLLASFFNFRVIKQYYPSANHTNVLTNIGVGKCFCPYAEYYFNKKTLLRIDAGHDKIDTICTLLYAMHQTIL